MSEKWPGGFIKPIPPTPAGPYQDGAASGVWTMDQMSYWLKQGLWPIAGNVNARAVFAGGYTGSVYTNVMDYISIASTGNAIDFGDLIFNNSVYNHRLSGCSSSTRGIFSGGGSQGDQTNTIQYITILSTGNTLDFGDLSAPAQTQSFSNSTRGVIGLGWSGNFNYYNTIDYITIASTGNALDFGDRIVEPYISAAGCSNSTRGLFGGGGTSSNVIQYVTIATTGNSTDFGDLTVARSELGACASSTRAVFAGGSNTNVLDYVTIASAGNAVDFGDLIQTNNLLAGTSSSTRGVFGGGNSGPSNVIQYITISTTGNTTDFGDLTVGRYGLAACSNAHGGL